jgi:putative N-acetylmannosamine-6-phosphate epimerase
MSSSYDAKHTTWTIHVKLQPGRKYSFMLNSDQYSSFQSQEGVPLKPTQVIFQTAKAASGAGEAAAKRP